MEAKIRRRLGDLGEEDIISQSGEVASWADATSGNKLPGTPGRRFPHVRDCGAAHSVAAALVLWRLGREGTAGRPPLSLHRLLPFVFQRFADRQEPTWKLLVRNCVITLASSMKMTRRGHIPQLSLDALSSHGRAYYSPQCSSRERLARHTSTTCQSPKAQMCWSSIFDCAPSFDACNVRG
jgi:hypothetical protein